MANIVEYTLSLQDKVSGKLRTIGIVNDQQFAKWGQVQLKVLAVSNTMSKCGISVGSLRERIAALRAEREWIPTSNIQAIRHTNREITALEKQVQKLERTTGGGLKSAFKNAFDSLPLGGLITNPVFLAVTAAGAAIKKGFEREKVQISFEVLLGGKEAGQKMTDEIRKFGAATPYLTANLNDNAKMMLGFGVAAERVMPNIKMLGDIAMGDQEKMSSLTLAFSQMTAAGRLMGQDLLQMINAGFNPLNEMSRTTGKSMAVLRKEMENGKISSEMVRNAFVSATSAGGKFYGMTDKLGQSKSGKWSTILDNGIQLLWKLYDIIEPVLNPALNTLSWLIDYIGIGLEWVRKILTTCVDAFGWWFTQLQNGNIAITAVTFVLGVLVATMAAFSIQAKLMTLWAGIVTTAKWAWAAAQTALNTSMWLCPITWIVAGIIALIAIIVYLCYKIEGWGSLWEGVVGYMKYSFYAFVDGVKLYFSTLVNSIMIGLNMIKLGWYKFKEACGIGNSEENQSAIAAINADVEARQKAIVNGAKKVLDNAKKANDSLTGFKMSWNSGKSLSDITSGLKSKLGISSPGVPGMEISGGKGNSGGSVGDKKATEAVTTGGSRSSTINITLGNLVERIIFEGGYESNRDQMEKDIESALIRVLQMARTAQ
ncbi:MAG: tape measure protein [Alistipes sp.]